MLSENSGRTYRYVGRESRPTKSKRKEDKNMKIKDETYEQLNIMERAVEYGYEKSHIEEIVKYSTKLLVEQAKSGQLINFDAEFPNVNFTTRWNSALHDLKKKVK